MRRRHWPFFSDMPQPESRAEHYAAVSCKHCDETICLVLDSDKESFRCRDLEACRWRRLGLNGDPDDLARRAAVRQGLVR